MTSQASKPRNLKSTPRPAVGPTAASTARSLRRVSQTAYSASQQGATPQRDASGSSGAAPSYSPPVAVIARIPNFSQRRSAAETPHSAGTDNRPLAEDPYDTLSRAARGIHPNLSAANLDQAPPTSTMSTASKSAASENRSPLSQAASQPSSQTSTHSPHYSPPHSPAAAGPRTRDTQGRWVENLPEWQRFAIQAVVMIVAAICVVGGFAIWRHSNESSPEPPISRQAFKELEIDEGTLEGEPTSDEPRAALARKPARAADWSDRGSSTTSPPEFNESQVAPSVEGPASSEIPSYPNTQTPSTPTTELTPAAPSINAPEQAEYPSTDPRRFQFGGVAPASPNGSQSPGPGTGPSATESSQPPAETARLGEITPLRTGNLR